MTTMVERVAKAESRIKDVARRKVRDAVKQGILVRPNTCSNCGMVPSLARDGRTQIHAHHHNGYLEPLDVIWVCAACHAKLDKRASGECQGTAVLTAQQVLAIRRRYNPHAKNRHSMKNGQRALAREFGVNPSTIRRIVLGKTWSHISAALEGK